MVSLSELEKAFGPSSLGIIIVRDLPPEFVALRQRVLSYSSYLANLPDPELKGLEHEGSKYLVGWSRGKEKLKDDKPDMLKGSYYINCAFHVQDGLQAAPTTAPNDSEEPYGAFTEYTTPNVWPGESLLPGLEQASTELCNLIIDVAVLVAQACDRFAQQNVEGYTPGYLERVVRTSMTTKARLLHYFPPEEVANGHAAESQDDDDWCATHVDHGCLTGLTSAMFVDEDDCNPSVSSITSRSPLLPLPELKTSPDPDAGLYIHSRKSEVTKVAIPKDCLAFQTGSALETITKGKFRAVPHFVRGPSSTTPGKVARNTLAVFTQPNLWELVDVDRGIDFAGFARAVVSKNY